MKRAVLALFAISCGFILLGLCFAAAGGFRIAEGASFVTYGGSGSYARLSQPQTQEKTVSAGDCKSVDLELVNTKLEVIPESGDEIRLQYETIYRNEWQVSFSGSQLKLENVKYRNVINGYTGFLNFIRSLRNGDFRWDIDLNGDSGTQNSEMHTVRLYLPASAAQDLTVHSVNGSITMNQVSAKTLDMTLVNCGLDATDAAIGDSISLNDVNGQLQFKNLRSPELNLSSVVNGTCELSSPQVDRINASSFVNGTLSLTGISDPQDYGVNYQLVNGSVRIGDNTYGSQGNISGGKYKIHFQGVNSSLLIGQ